MYHKFNANGKGVLKVMDSKNQDIFIVITQTGTILSNLLKVITRAEYNHISIALSSDLDYMFSFGRKNAYFPFWGGFVIESRNWGTFKRFSNTKAMVFSLSVEEKVHQDILDYLNFMQNNRHIYGYNYFGLLLAGLKIHCEFKNRFYCSEFVSFLLKKFKIKGSEQLNSIVKPIDFLCLPDIKCIYSGSLKDYTENTKIHI